MRASILLWSMVSGAILGLFVDATLIGVALFLSVMLPGVSSRLYHRWIIAAVAVVLAAIPILLSVLGYFEGELKTV